MAGSLIKIDEEIVTSAVASVTLGGSDWDSSYDVYVLKINQMETDRSSDNQFYMRLLASSSPDTSSNYDRATKRIRAGASFDNDTSTNSSFFQFTTGLDNGTGSQLNGVFYLFNFNNASEYSFITCELSSINSANELIGATGGGVLTVAQATNGVQLFFNLDNIDNGVFTLFGLKK